MNRVSLILAVALTLLAATAFAQNQPGTSPTQSTIPATSSVQQGSDMNQAQTQGTDPTQAPPAATPSTSTDPAASGTTQMPNTASPMPLVALSGFAMFLAALGLSARRRNA